MEGVSYLQISLFQPPLPTQLPVHCDEQAIIIIAFPTGLLFHCKHGLSHAPLQS